MNLEAEGLILFDGVCVLCSRFVDFVIARDPSARFRFATLQSDFGARMLSSYDLQTEALSTLVLIEGGRAYTESTAALRIARRLHGVWRFTFVLILVPPALRDRIYRWIGRNRYQWFGQTPLCRVPTAEERDRFLE